MSSIFEKITEREKKLIREYIYRYATEKGYECESLPYVLRLWSTNKAYLFKNLFHEELILKKRIYWEQDYEGLAHLYDSSTSENDDIKYFYNNYLKFLHDRYSTIDWWRLDNKIKEEYYAIESLVSSSAIIANKYSNSFENEFENDGKHFKLKTGMKAMRALAKFAEIFNIDGFEKFRIAVSQILNQKTLSGELCLSIHPMDYMTMSDNACGWSSCMSWKEDGCYRQGTVEMMNSSCVIVAYLNSEHYFNPIDGTVCSEDDNYAWSNKKWRELYIVSDELITNIKSYPYNNESLTKEVLNWLRDLHWDKENFHEKMIRYTDSHGIYDEDRDITYPVKRFEFYTDRMYNDITSNSGKLQFAYLKKDIDKSYIEVNYSGSAECMICGAILDSDYEGEESSLVCESCIPCYRCSNCGEHCDEDELYEVDGEYLCRDCYETETDYDTFTDEIHLTCNLSKIYFEKDGYIYHNLCIYAYDLNTVYEEFNHLLYKKSYYNNDVCLWNPDEGCYGKFFVRYEDITEDLAEYFFASKAEMEYMIANSYSREEVNS